LKDLFNFKEPKITGRDKVEAGTAMKADPKLRTRRRDEYLKLKGTQE
jgi:hypothetical protein